MLWVIISYNVSSGDEVAGVNGGVDDSGRGEEGEGGEEHYERAPISQAASASLKLDGWLCYCVDEVVYAD